MCIVYSIYTTIHDVTAVAARLSPAQCKANNTEIDNILNGFYT